MIAFRATPDLLRACPIAVLAVGVVTCVPLVRPVAAAAATLTVSTTRDEVMAHDGRCSLREAIAAVKSPGTRNDCGRVSRGSNTIVLSSGRYLLSIARAGADENASGDLDVDGATPLTITGAGPRATMIDAGGLGDRVLSAGSRAKLVLSRLSITGGRAPAGSAGASGVAGVGCAAGGTGSDGLDAGDSGSGGGIFNAGKLVLDLVAVTGNTAGAGGAGGSGGDAGCNGGDGGLGGGGGGIYNRGRLTLVDSTVSGNRAGAGGGGGSGDANPLRAPGTGGSGGPGGSGGGLDNHGTLSVRASTISRNSAGAGGLGGSGAGPLGADGGGGVGASGGGIFSGARLLRVIDSTVYGNLAGAGGAGGERTSAGGTGGNGGGIAVVGGPSQLLNATVAANGVGTGGGAGGSESTAANPGAAGVGGGLFVQSTLNADDMHLQNTIVASSLGANCAGSTASAIAGGGRNLSYGDLTCPGRRADPKLGPLKDNGGPTATMAIAAGSAAIGAIPASIGGCPATDQRGVRRPQGRACDTGAYEFAIPQITMAAPFQGASYERGSRIRARFRCEEGGVASTIATCTGSVARGHAISTRRLDTLAFVVTAIDKNGMSARRTVHYDVWIYVNPVREVSGLTPRRIDLGVDYAGTGPLLAIGRARVTMASDTDSGPPSCWAITCWPGGGIVVMRLLDGPFAGKYVYVAEHITVSVRAGQTVSAGQRIATLYAGYPWSEWGWAAGPGPEAMAMADGHWCHTCPDVGDWSTVEGRNMNALLVRLGAPSGLFQPIPYQSMPPGWPTWPGHR